VEIRKAKIHMSVWSRYCNPQLLPNITDYSAERSPRPMGMVVMQNRWAFISSECLREICRRFGVYSLFT